jgi:hypothetical protein
MTYAQRIFRSTSALAVAAMAFVPFAASADVTGAIQTGLNGTAGAAGYGTSAPKLDEIAGRLINQLLGFVGVILMLYVLYGGFMWMTAAGEAKKVETAKNVIRDAVIGLVIIATAFTLTNFVLVNIIGCSLSGTCGK